MSVSEHANYLLNEYGRLQFDYAAYCKPDGEPLRNEARNNLEEYIAELEALVVSLGDALTATYNSLPTHWRDHYHCPYSYTGLMLEIKKLKVKDWKERELGWN